MKTKHDAATETRACELVRVKEKLTHTLDMLDVYGVSGVLAVCLLPGGASYLAAGGACVDLDGATRGLAAGMAAIRDLAMARGDEALGAALAEALAALQPVAETTGPVGAIH
jgi:hypothetical protein